jgi:hypothetical protein
MSSAHAADQPLALPLAGAVLLHQYAVAAIATNHMPVGDSMPAVVAAGAEAPAAQPAADESAARHGGLEKQVAQPFALSPAQPHISEGRQHPRRSIDVEPAQVWHPSAIPECSDTVQRGKAMMRSCLLPFLMPLQFPHAYQVIHVGNAIGTVMHSVCNRMPAGCRARRSSHARTR